MTAFSLNMHQSISKRHADWTVASYVLLCSPQAYEQINIKIYFEIWYNHNEIQHNKTVYLFYGE